MNTPRLHDGMRLVSTRTAITCAGLFVVSSLMKWDIRTVLHSAVIEVEAMVTDAVKATGIPEERMHWSELARIEYITVQLYGFDTGVRIEVWDSAPNPPVLSNEAGSPVKRGYYSLSRGKVVWAELPLLDQRISQAPPLPPDEGFVQSDPELLQRVWYGIQNL